MYKMYNVPKFYLQGCLTTEKTKNNFKKIVAQKINVILFFDTEFFRYFFRVLHEASSSWLKFVHGFQKHPVYVHICILSAL
jgi:hypothetical protein